MKIFSEHKKPDNVKARLMERPRDKKSYFTNPWIILPLSLVVMVFIVLLTILVLLPGAMVQSMIWRGWNELTEETYSYCDLVLVVPVVVIVLFIVYRAWSRPLEIEGENACVTVSRRGLEKHHYGMVYIELKNGLKVVCAEGRLKQSGLFRKRIIGDYVLKTVKDDLIVLEHRERQEVTEYLKLKSLLDHQDMIIGDLEDRLDATRELLRSFQHKGSVNKNGDEAKPDA